MFYAHFVLAKKGPLARIWLAAHWDKKLTKAHVFETNIESSVEGILQPKVKMALRTSGHLLLGIVRIYSRKAKYLLADCNEAFIKIKMAFRPGVVDLPEGNREAAVATITLPEVFHDFDTAMPDITIDMDAQVTLNQSRAEDITLKEDYGTLSLMTDDGFGDMAFDDPEVARDATNIDDGFDHASLLLCEDQKTASGASIIRKSDLDLDSSLKDDGFAGPVGDGLLDVESSNLFEPAGLFDDAPLGHVPLETASEQNVENLGIDKRIDCEPRQDDESDDDMYDMGPASMGAPSPPSSADSPGPALIGDGVAEPDTLHRNDNGLDGGLLGGAADILSVPNEMPPPFPPLDQGNLTNEDESFALAPLDATIVQGAERTVKAKRKRKLIVDEMKNISGEEMKAQLSDTTDIITTLDLAPPTKRLMHSKETGGVEKLFALPGHPILSKLLSRSYQRHLTTRSVDNEDFDFGIEEDSIELDADLEQAREESEMIARKRRREMEPVLQQDLSHLDSLHLDSTDHNLAHESLEVSSFLHNQHHLFPPLSSQQLEQTQQQMMPPVMPSVMSSHPPHMIHQMLHPDVNQLSVIPHMMHQTMAGMHEVPPVVAETYGHHAVIEPVPQHLLSEAIPQIPDHLQPPPLSSGDKLMPRNSLLNDQLNQLSQEHVPCVENEALHPCVDAIISPCIDSQVLHSAIDDDMTQPSLEQYSHIDGAVSMNNAVPNLLNSTIIDEHQQTVQNANLADELNQRAEAHSDPALSLFQCLNNGEIQTESNQMRDIDDTIQKNQFPLSDDEDDYGAPASVGPILPEEQMDNETYEQFEERILNKRTTHMLHIIHSKLDNDRSVNFSDIVRNNQRKQVAQKFYTFLVLKKQQAVELEQQTSYGELVITRGPKFTAVYNGN